MDTLYNFADKVKNFFCRITVYQMTIIWLYMKYSNLDKSTDDFKQKIFKNLTFFGIDNSFFEFLFNDPIIINFILLISETIFLLMALFGNRFGSWMVAFHFSFTTFLFFNPFLPENRFSLLKLDARHDMVTAYGVLLCFLLIASYPENDIIDENYVLGEVEDGDTSLDDDFKEK